MFLMTTALLLSLFSFIKQMAMYNVRFVSYFGQKSQIMHVSTSDEQESFKQPFFLTDQPTEEVKIVEQVVIRTNPPTLPLTKFIYPTMLRNTVPTIQPTRKSPKSKNPTVTQPKEHTYSGFVSFTPSESGLGNNLFGLTSAFLIAAVLNKQLTTSGNYAYDSAFSVIDYWNNTVKSSQQHGQAGTSFREYNRCFSKKSQLVQRIIKSSISSIFHSKLIRISTNCPLFLYFLQQEDNRKILTSLGLLQPSQSTHPQYDQEAFHLYSYFLRNHIILSPKIRSIIDSRLADRQHQKLLCMHIRCGTPLSDFKDQSTFLKSKDISIFQSCQRQFDWSGEASILVASDSSKAKMRIQKYNPHKDVFWWYNTTSHTMTRHFSKTSLSTIESSVMDLFSLGSCDGLIGTARSTYSLTAAALTGRIPYLVSMGSKACAIPDKIVFG